MIDYFILDVDGVFTDGTFYYSSGGKVMKKFGPHDSDGIKLIRARTKVKVFAISADHRGFEITRSRMDDMGIPLTLVAEDDRYDYLKNTYPKEKTAFMGDGPSDAKFIAECRFGIAPRNGVEECKKNARFVTGRCGGDGAVYEACKRLLTLMEGSNAF